MLLEDGLIREASGCVAPRAEAARSHVRRGARPGRRSWFATAASAPRRGLAVPSSAASAPARNAPTSIRSRARPSGWCAHACAASRIAWCDAAGTRTPSTQVGRNRSLEEFSVARWPEAVGPLRHRVDLDGKRRSRTAEPGEVVDARPRSLPGHPPARSPPRPAHVWVRRASGTSRSMSPNATRPVRVARRHFRPLEQDERSVAGVANALEKQGQPSAWRARATCCCRRSGSGTGTPSTIERVRGQRPEAVDGEARRVVELRLDDVGHGVPEPSLPQRVDSPSEYDGVRSCPKPRLCAGAPRPRG